MHSQPFGFLTYISFSLQSCYRHVPSLCFTSAVYDNNSCLLMIKYLPIGRPLGFLFTLKWSPFLHGFTINGSGIQGNSQPPSLLNYLFSTLSHPVLLTLPKASLHPYSLSLQFQSTSGLVRCISHDFSSRWCRLLRTIGVDC